MVIIEILKHFWYGSNVGASEQFMLAHPTACLPPAEISTLPGVSIKYETMRMNKLQIIPLGGLGEFGMNCLALRWQDDILVIDAGLMFPETELLGVDIVVPDITYLIENKQHVRGIVLTHGHEDHIGGLPWILSELKVPVYATEFTLAYVEGKLEEHGSWTRPSLSKSLRARRSP